MDRIERAEEVIRRILEEKGRAVVAVDGRCAAGKTTFAKELARRLDANLIAMDDFFLPPELRTEERLARPGGNVHYERFMREVLEPLTAGEAFSYGVFDCGVMRVTRENRVEPRPVTVVEGSYSMHPALRAAYDLGIFLTVESAEQRRRLLLREGEAGLRAFLEKWIPLEERYFAACAVEESCGLRL